jgi:putrescine transport system permease protein
VITAHTTLGAAYVTAIVRSRLLNLDPLLSEAALDLGARPAKVFFLIKLPIIVPSIIASWLIAFIISFDDVVLASFTSGPGITTLPLMIFSSIKVGYTPQINALAACITGMISILIMSAGYALNKKESQ